MPTNAYLVLLSLSIINRGRRTLHFVDESQIVITAPDTVIVQVVLTQAWLYGSNQMTFSSRLDVGIQLPNRPQRTLLRWGVTAVFEIFPRMTENAQAQILICRSRVAHYKARHFRKCPAAVLPPRLRRIKLVQLVQCHQGSIVSAEIVEI